MQRANTPLRPPRVASTIKKARKLSLPPDDDQHDLETTLQNKHRHHARVVPLRAISTMGIAASLPLSFPSVASASTSSTASTSSLSTSPHHLLNTIPHALLHMDDRSMYICCLTVGTTFSLLTIAVTGRFILSFFPGLERAARQARGPIALRAFVILDGLLMDPAQRRVFRMKEEGDVNYAAMLVLACMSAILEVMFGQPNGLLAQSVPDAGMLYFLNYLIFCQQMLLLPQWAMAVFRHFLLI